ncbi:hypothetical protein AKO1_005745 [Acrasis kona]|uniref:Uncharacterized protein n=1 Tax=Acrasis kona TaxID=1008807 RepID=A0AAW2YK39_9EUKA
MYITIQTSKTEAHEVELETLDIDEGVVTVTAQIDDAANEPKSSFIMLAERLMRDESQAKWMGCANINKPLFTIIGENNNVEIQFDNSTGSTQFRVDIVTPTNIFNQLQEVVSFKFQPQQQSEYPLYRLVFQPYRDNVIDKASLTPPFIFGVCNQADPHAVKAKQALDEIKSLIGGVDINGHDEASISINSALNQLSRDTSFKLPDLLPTKPQSNTEQPSPKPRARTKFSLHDIIMGDPEDKPPTPVLSPITGKSSPASRNNTPETSHKQLPSKRSKREADSDQDYQSPSESADEDNEISDAEEENENEATIDEQDEEYTERPSKKPRKSAAGATTSFKCSVCHKTRKSQVGDIKRQITKSNVYLYELVFNKKVSCGRVCTDCLTTYNASPCTVCKGTDFKSGTLSLKPDMIPMYEESFNRNDLSEGKLCRACYGKFYTIQNKNLNKKISKPPKAV